MIGSCVLRETILKGRPRLVPRAFLYSIRVRGCLSLSVCSVCAPSIHAVCAQGRVDHEEAAQSDHSPSAASGYVYAGQTQSRSFVPCSRCPVVFPHMRYLLIERVGRQLKTPQISWRR